MKRGDDGYCNLLDKETKLCTVYEIRPETCKNYKNTQCTKIRKIV